MKIFIVGLVLALFLKKGGNLPTYNYDLNSIYRKYGSMYSVDWKLLKAVAIVESDERPDAVNPADPSYGLMQLLYPNKLPAISQWPPASVDMLYDPDYSVKIGAQILAWNIKNFGLQKGIATYNNWSARNAPQYGPFPNENYVHKVMTQYRKLDDTNFEGSKTVPDDIY